MSTSITITKKRKQLAGVLLLLVLAGLFSGYYVSAPEPKKPSSEPLDGMGESMAEKEVDRVAERAAEEQALAPAPIPSSISSINPKPALQEDELEHLNDVFLSSLYPLFQYDFPLDREGRSAIDVFVASMPDGLSDEGLDAVSAMIQAQLRTPEAEDLAFIITHLYRLGQEEARMLNEGDPITTMEGQLKAQEQLSQLREEWFGPELSARLFPGAEDLSDSAAARTEDSRPDGADSEEPTERVTEAQAELADIERHWERRYQAFLADKQVIERAGLDQSEKDQQIEALFRQHYTPQELEAARAFDQSRQ